jgi:hypothetical protein
MSRVVAELSWSIGNANTRLLRASQRHVDRDTCLSDACSMAGFLSRWPYAPKLIRLRVFVDGLEWSWMLNEEERRLLTGN